MGGAVEDEWLVGDYGTADPGEREWVDAWSFDFTGELGERIGKGVSCRWCSADDEDRGGEGLDV